MSGVPRINSERLLDRLRILGGIGRSPSGGLTRIAFTGEDYQARAQVIAWMQEAGLEVCRDPIGNLFGIQPERSEAPVLSGSHIDSVANAGHLDGALGVVAALEVLQTVRDNGIQVARPLAVAVFANEEGVRFQPDMMGSLVMAGGLSLEEALARTDTAGISLRDSLHAEPQTRAIQLNAIKPARFVELHIEQGPVLEAADTQIGIVEGVQGIFWAEVIFYGRAGHAGTTPLALRADAGLAAMSFATQLHQRLSALDDSQLLTIGEIELQPGMINVIPRTARLTIDMRNRNAAKLSEAKGILESTRRGIETAFGVHSEIKPKVDLSPVGLDGDIIARLGALAEKGGLSWQTLVSGAGHDAQMMAAIAPSAMIFVPSIGGISHNPREATHDEDLVAGANLLLDAMLDLAR